MTHWSPSRSDFQLIPTDPDGNTYRAVYTVRFANDVYVLHVFQKKSKKGIQTPNHVVELIRARLRRAEKDHREREKQA